MKLSEIFSSYYSVRAGLVHAVKGLTGGQLDYVAPGGKNSIGWLLAHIAHAEHKWINVVATARDSSPDYGRFYGVTEPEALIEQLEETFGDFSQFLESNTVEDWDSEFFTDPDVDQKVSMRWIVWHLVEHQSRHRGQIFMLMGLQGIEVPNV